MSLMTKVDYLEETKSAIKNAIISKGVEVSDTDTFRSYADKIGQISGGGTTDEWQPQFDWWNIDKILEEDTENYQGSVICLLRDISNFSNIEPMKAAKIVTSDGSTYNDLTEIITHTWDISKDKECSLGYKTRYVIWYFNSSSFPNNYGKFFPRETIYSIFNLTESNDLFNSFCHLQLMEAIKFKNTTINGLCLINDLKNLKKIEGLTINGNVTASGVGLFGSCSSLEKINVTFSNDWSRSLRSAFSNMTSLKKFSFKELNLNPANVTEYWTTFQNDSTLQEIDKLDFTSLNTSNTANWVNMFGGCVSLIEINEISNIHMSGLNLSKCESLSHDTLLRFLNALYDYASEGSTDTYILTLGTTNLDKLTDEEKAIATNKGWTLN